MVANNELLNKAYSLYIDLQNKIRDVYKISEEYPIFHAEIDEILYDEEEYMHDLFIGIAFAQGEMTQEEQMFIEKLRVLPNARSSDVNTDDEIETVSSVVPLYIKLADDVDKYTLNTEYAKEFIKCTQEICKLLQDIDGNTYANESEFMYGVTRRLEKFLKESGCKDEK